MAGTKQKTRGDPAKAGKVTKQQPNKPKTTYAHIKDHNERAHTVYTSLKEMHQTKYCTEVANFPNGDMVTPEKIIEFMTDVVTTRGNTHANNERYSESAIKQHLSALSNLYHIQKRTFLADKKLTGSEDEWPYENPRECGSLAIFLKNYSNEEANRKKRSYVDRDIGTMRDGYTAQELGEVSCHYFKKATEVGMRDRFVFLLQHVMMLRGESTRRMDLTDIFCLGNDEQLWREFTEEGHLPTRLGCVDSLESRYGIK